VAWLLSSFLKAAVPSTLRANSSMSIAFISMDFISWFIVTAGVGGAAAYEKTFWFDLTSLFMKKKNQI